jgi:DNA-binding Lrp family transcriptional regulator
MKMQARLDSADVKILEAVGTHGPRNLQLLATELGMKRGTVWKRVRRLSSHFFLEFHVNPYHTNLGLKKAVVIAWANPGKEDLLFDCMFVNDFRNFISRCYGGREGCFGIYVVPVDHIPEFNEFLCMLDELGLTSDQQVVWSTCFQNVNLTQNWFDAKTESWTFSWDDWVEELVIEGTELPYTLKDPASFTNKADYTDIFIVKELEKDAAISFVDIAKKLNVNRQNVERHYRDHVVKRGLIESVQVTISPFDRRGASEPLFFHFRFSDETKMAKFALSLLDKPFVHFLGKVLGVKALVAYTHFLSKNDFREFISALSKIINRGYLQDYNYIFIDLNRRARETVRHDLFENGSWRYDHKKHVKTLQDLVTNGQKPELKGQSLSVMNAASK